MAHVYVDSNAAGSGTGADWANAYTTLAAALTAKAAGDNFWIAHNHAETQASAMTCTSPGTLAAPCTVMCVNSAGTVPPVSADLRTTATVTTTGNSAMTLTGLNTYYYGITFNCGSAANAATLAVAQGIASYTYFKDCALNKLGTTAATPCIIIGKVGSNMSRVVLDNVSFRVGNASDLVVVRECNCVWKNTTTFTSGTIPTVFLGQSNANRLLFEGVDFSALSTKTIFNGNTSAIITLLNCKLPSSITIAATLTQPGVEIYVLNTDSGATNYRQEKYGYFGTQTAETTIVRTGGATDGTTPLAWKIVTTANSNWVSPFESIQMAIWNDTTAANVTVTVYGYWDNAALPKNDEIWIEASYMGSSATPIGTINSANTKTDYLAANADQGSDSSTWGGGDTTTRFKMSVTLSAPQPAMKGLIYVTVKAAKASTTYYIDPKIVLS